MARLFDPLVAWLHKEVERSQELQQDPDFIENLLPWLERFVGYFDAQVRGFENLPARGPMMLVGNHSGGALAPDVAALLHAWYRRRGLDDRLVGLAFDAAFGIPVLGSILRRLGLLPASPQNARRVLRQGASLLVYPGGAHEVFRPWRERNRVDFGGHRGFVRLALRERVPVVPVVGHGAHETLVVLSRGEQLCRWLALDARLRIKVCPLVVPLPPLPARITVELGAPLSWSDYGPEAADDPSLVERLYEEMRAVLQARLDRLVQEQPRPLLGRWAPRRHPWQGRA